MKTPMITRSESVTLGALTFELQTAGEPHHPLVLLLHGFPQTSHSYRHALPALAKAGFYAVAPNQRGYSPKARPAAVADYATPLLIQDALGIADAVSPGGGQRFHLVGHDWGGQLAWLLATQHPDRLCSLSVLSRPHPRAFSAALKSDAAQSERSRHHSGYNDPTTANKLLAEDARRLRRMLSDQNVAEADAAAYIAPLREHAALDAALNWYRAVDRKAFAAELPNISVPTLYVWGDADATVGRTAAEATVSCVTAPYRFEVLTGAGHFLTDEQPARTTQLLCEHIAHWQKHARA